MRSIATSVVAPLAAAAVVPAGGGRGGAARQVEDERLVEDLRKLNLNSFKF